MLLIISSTCVQNCVWQFPKQWSISAWQNWASVYPKSMCSIVSVRFSSETPGRLTIWYLPLLSIRLKKYLVPMSDVHNDDVKNLLDKNKIQHGSCHVPHCQQWLYCRWGFWLWHAGVLLPVRRASVALKNFPDFDQKEIKIGTFGSTTARQSVMPDFVLTWKLPACRHPQWRRRLTCLSRKIIKESKRVMSYKLWVICL